GVLPSGTGCAPGLARHATLATLERNGVVPKAPAGTATSLGKLVCSSSHRLTSRLWACGRDFHLKNRRARRPSVASFCRPDSRYLTVGDFAVLLLVSCLRRK